MREHEQSPDMLVVLQAHHPLPPGGHELASDWHSGRDTPVLTALGEGVVWRGVVCRYRDGTYHPILVSQKQIDRLVRDIEATLLVVRGSSQRHALRDAQRAEALRVWALEMSARLGSLTRARTYIRLALANGAALSAVELAVRRELEAHGLPGD